VITRRKKIKGIIIFSLLFIFICLVKYPAMYNAPPNGIHDQAQSDRFSIAVQYYDNGMDFFHPRTYDVQADDRIVPVEFPIQAYLAALSGKIFGREAISTSFRIITLLIGYLGLLSLFLIAFNATGKIISSLFIPVVIFSSPVFSYYLCNYLPDAAALCSSFAGFYFFTLYLENTKFGTLVTSICILTLAALMKTSVGVVLLSVMGYSLFTRIAYRKGVSLLQQCAFFLLPLIVLVSYNLYSKYLATTYHGTLFMMQTYPFENWDERHLFFTYCLTTKFVNEYFTTIHYPVLGLIVLYGLVAIFKDKKQRVQLVLIALLFTGSLVLTFLFGHQLIHHNYYFISIWFPAITISLVLFFIPLQKAIAYLPNRVPFNIALMCMLVVLQYSGNLYLNKMIVVDEKTYPDVHDLTTDYWFAEGDSILNSLSIGKDSTIAVVDEIAPNLSLCYFDRNGLVLPPGEWNNSVDIKHRMNLYGIHIMACKASKIKAIDTAEPEKFTNTFTELYNDNRCAVYCLKP